MVQGRENADNQDRDAGHSSDPLTAAYGAERWREDVGDDPGDGSGDHQDDDRGDDVGQVVDDALDEIGNGVRSPDAERELQSDEEDGPEDDECDQIRRIRLRADECGLKRATLNPAARPPCKCLEGSFKMTLPRRSSRSRFAEGSRRLEYVPLGLGDLQQRLRARPNALGRVHAPTSSTFSP